MLCNKVGVLQSNWPLGYVHVYNIGGLCHKEMLHDKSNKVGVLQSYWQFLLCTTCL